MNLASGVAVYKARKIQIHKKTFPANVSAHPTQPGAREEWQGSAPPLPRHRLYTKRQGGGKGGGGGVRSLLKFSSGYTPVSTGLTNSIYHRKKMKRWRKRLVTSQLNPQSHSRARPLGRGHSTTSYTGRLRPEIQPITLLYTIFDRNGTPFVYLLLTNDTPFSYLAVRVLHAF